MTNSPGAYLYLGLLILLAALSVKTLAVLRGASPWTSAGWLLSLIYCIIVCGEIIVRRTVAPIWPDGALVLMIAAFIVAGVKDERQADPWWWPTRPGRTRRERSLG